MMNKIRVVYLVAALLLLSMAELSAQHYIGIKGGMGGGTIRMNPTEEQNTMWGLPTFSVAYKYLGGDPFFGGIEIDLNYSQKGYITLPRLDSDTSYQRTVNSIEIPFMWHPHVNMAHNKMRVFLNAGPYVAYNLSSYEKTVSQERGVLEEGEYEWDALRDNRLEYGLMFGGGFNVKITSALDLQAEFRYTMGFSDLLKNTTKYSDNPYESPLTVMSVLIGINYRLWNGKSRKKDLQIQEYIDIEMSKVGLKAPTDSEDGQGQEAEQAKKEIEPTEEIPREETPQINN